MRREDVVDRAHRAAEAFARIGFPYYATYFRWREAEAMLDLGARPAGVELLKRARAEHHTPVSWDSTPRSWRWRTDELRLGPACTTIVGDEALSVREL